MILDTLWWTNIAIENGHLYWIFPLKMVIFHGYVVHQRVCVLNILLKYVRKIKLWCRTQPLLKYNAEPMPRQKIMAAAEPGKHGNLCLFLAALSNKWVCLKMVSTPKPNGFADHYPVSKWLAIIGNINPTFSGPNPNTGISMGYTPVIMDSGTSPADCFGFAQNRVPHFY